MKKIISLILTLTLLLSLAACGNSEKEAQAEAQHIFEISKSAYDSIKTAYEITDRYASDIYEAWYMAIYDKKALTGYDGASNLAKKTNLSLEEITEACSYAAAVEIYMEDWDALTEEEKDEYRGKSPDAIFVVYDDLDMGLFSLCVRLINYVYTFNGEADKAQASLDEAKVLMKEMSEKYSDYEHYPNLKGYFTTTSSFFEFCKDPAGSFEQYTDTNNNYRNEIRDYVSDLDFIFEE